jgi:DNA-binding NarL/FixJ family response regulator
MIKIHRSNEGNGAEGCQLAGRDALIQTLTKPPIRSLTKAKVLIVHGVPLTRIGLAALIESGGRYEVCAQTGNAPAARQLFVEHSPELTVLSLTLDGGDGIELIKDFQKLNRSARILVFSTRDDTLSIQRTFRAGARGYLVAHENVLEISKALDEIAAGHFYASPSLSRRLLENLATGGLESGTSELAALSDRERQVFSLIGRGFGATRLARELHLSVKTIETHQTRIKQKLELRSASELAEKATEWMLASVRRNLQARRDGIFKNGHSQSR